ncbi:hypothetical protein MRS76_25425 [Rhizobiaceae bacterium n13]|nr:hypothetical protein [Fererhizobium litorale]MDI7865243.1 hypothetical protein [Fererhizobium litorale]
MLIIGLGRAMAGEVAIGLGEDQVAMQSAFASNWRLAAPTAQARHGFAVLVPTEAADQPLTTIRLGEEATGAHYIFSPRLASAQEAATLVTASAGPQSAAVVNRLVDVLMAGKVNRRTLMSIAALLQVVHSSDGFVELIGESHDGQIFLQGWSRSMAPGRFQVSMVGNFMPVVAGCDIASFSRPDTPEGASGFVGLFDAGETVSAFDIEGLVFHGTAGWRFAAVHPKKRITNPLETPECIRSTLLRTQSTPDVLLSLRAAANSFDGKETVSSLPYPVRMGVDSAFEADGGNLLVSGWLYDPDGHVEAARLRRRETAVRLDMRWTRLERPDVTDSFKEHPHFVPGPRGEQHAHGFIAHVQLPGGDPGAPLYFELTLRDSRRAFLPVKPTRVSARVAVMRQIGSIDPSNCALPSIVDAQVVPFLNDSERSTPTVGKIQDIGSFDQERSPPIVIGVGESEEHIFPLLALLALDPETRNTPIVVAIPAERFRTQVTRLEELVRFYQLSARLVSANNASDVYDLLEVATQALSCETVVLLSASLIPNGSGWYNKLVARAATLKGSIVSPVLAYEDHSVRWAGNWLDDGSCNQPIVGRYAGYPLKAVTGMPLTRIAAASLECCILPREALLRTGGFSGGYLGSREKGLDLALHLSLSGIDSFLLPSVQMWGCDDTSYRDTPALATLMEQIDRTILMTRWWPASAPEYHFEKKVV